ncbi:hypothetical protein KAH81_08230 [bacterium]|nr:hypothetical protein [bacterium]
MDVNLDIIVSIPSKPLPESCVEGIAKIIRSIPEIYFAYLPELFIPGQMDEATLVLILVSDLKGEELAKITYNMNSCICELLPSDNEMNILVVEPDHEIVQPTIETGCLVEINNRKKFEQYIDLTNL